MLSMLINKINPRALNSGSNISNRLQQIRQQNSLAAHGFVSGNCQSVSYEAFRHCLSDIATPLVCSKKGTTFIFNQQQKVCALIKPPYFDSRGQCQPVRYFLAEGVQLSAFSSLRRIELPRLLWQAKIHSIIQGSLKSVKQLLTPSNTPTRAMSKRKTPVWTSMRLTA
ncbi:MAG: hypothetical protein HOO01_07070 [Cellvibrionales bacterium]|jgi:AraC-like DNA-binding protein|nr:hypothetical protein [Cellvibrionales bacterium]MBT6580019.1 hypothetical protein [Cellvibrionales bacterium]